MPPSIFDSRELDETLFWPRDDPDPSTPAGATDFTIAVPGATLHARWHRCPQPRATVIVFHGNGEIVADYDDFAPRYREHDADLVVVDFRGYGRSTGTPSYRSTITDSIPAVKAVIERGVPRPLLVLGRSLGGACAAELAGSRDAIVDAIVMESAASDLRAFIMRRGLAVPPAFTDEETAVFDPRPKLARCQLPVLVLHGADDTLIRPSEARANFEVLTTEDRQLVLVPGAGHNDVMAAPLYWQSLGAFVERVATRAATDTRSH